MITVIRNELYLITKLAPHKIDPTKKPGPISKIERGKKPPGMR